MSARIPIVAVALLVIVGGCASTAPSGASAARSTAVPATSTLEMTTWSIAAIDPMTGDVGVAMASCVPNTHGDAVAALVPGHGVAAVQAGWDLTNRNRVYDASWKGSRRRRSSTASSTRPPTRRSVADNTAS